MSATAKIEKKLATVDARLQEVDVEGIAAEVVASRTRIRGADPEAHAGFVTDAAIRAVAKRTGEDWRVVLKAYRTVHPASGSRGFPNFRGASPVSDAGKAVA